MMDGTLGSLRILSEQSNWKLEITMKQTFEGKCTFTRSYTLLLPLKLHILHVTPLSLTSGIIEHDHLV